MNEIARNRIAGLTFWVVVWFMGLAGLALASVPADSNCHSSEAAAAAYYSPAQTTSVYQDADGTHSVLVRSLRPVVVR
ncbi:MAG: hypothetical protein RIM84_26730 [Alphaproteobacteria bacterium]